MSFSRKTIPIKLKARHPIQAATKVFNVSASATSALARCYVYSSHKTTQLFRSVRNGGLSRAYSATGRNSSDGLEGTKSTPLYRKLISAWTETPTKWYPLPLAVGALLLVALQYRKRIVSKTETEAHLNDDGMEIVKLKGPWQVHVLGALPLRNMSRLWGYLNSLELPVWFRPIGINLYATAFGCDLTECDPSDLREYASLGAFFYRKLKDGIRPVDKAALVSPADGRVLHFGTIQDLRVEQVKGITYSLDALLGVDKENAKVVYVSSKHRDMTVVDDREFANVNGIEYTLDQLIGGAFTPGTTTPATPSSSPPSQTPPIFSETAILDAAEHPPPKKFGERIDASVKPPSETLQETLVHDASVALELASEPSPQAKTKRASLSGKAVKEGHSLFFTVIYLAPGDYHRFHSPTAWVVEKRRHFVGELFSVSPYMAKRLEGLFVLNERVALLGKWKYGFFGMVPVGATNVGSIKVNFDQDLRTNIRGRRQPPGMYTEAVYAAASPILNGQPLLPAQEMGGFCLGSTIVLVFEAPKEFQFAIEAGQKVKVGQRLGDVSGK